MIKTTSIIVETNPQIKTCFQKLEREEWLEKMTRTHTEKRNQRHKKRKKKDRKREVYTD